MDLEVRGEIRPDLEPDGYQEELDSPYAPPKVGQALCDYVAQAPDGYVVMERFWLALARRLHLRLRVPVLVCDVDVPIAEQLARQQNLSPADPLTGLDVAVSQRIDEHRIAVVWAAENEMAYVASSRAPADPTWISLNTELSRDPEVRAGVLPAGAAGALVQDRSATWHSAPIGRNVWLAVLPQRSGQGEPALRYLDVEGAPFELTLPFAGVPALWPQQAPGSPKLGLTGPDLVTYRAGDWTVTVTGESGYTEAVLKPIPGTVLGHVHGFGLKTVDDGWNARAECGNFIVRVEGIGETPARLDLVEIAKSLKGFIERRQKRRRPRNGADSSKPATSLRHPVRPSASAREIG
ncbi:hypothetical protein DVA67_032755 [Solirubrobacter sp. CPCC 204708]|uniref:Uncharacterized protein n=1 Tax=Solirubrobacter deserti TaxID=2282478 RepID=A0ABT4RTH9_9ACTN|nr:hypothetical protein [Solirubrobacter deserti]MBE2320776.1 hypothetical protein [Solirubrobacter deserti]MDA0141879.1 hypothetical protein [Solirubrobacter deserti]